MTFKKNHLKVSILYFFPIPSEDRVKPSSPVLYAWRSLAKHAFYYLSYESKDSSVSFISLQFNFFVNTSRPKATKET
jgi:hypothetical protein